MRKMKWVLWILAGWISTTHAQQPTLSYAVTGSIRDAVSRGAVAYATINVFDSAKNSIASTYSLENGTFKTTLPRPGEYTFEITFVGYKTKELNMTIVRTPADLGIVVLTPGNDYLQEVHIISRKRLVDQKPGMLVYNAENDVSNKGGTAADVLRKAPVLNVDAQGNVSMRGSTNLKILVNGKYSGQMARSAADALNMMPADMIKSVEIITTPSAKYDAEGAAGVINIITRKGKGDISGTLEASASNLEQMLNPRLTYSDAKWNINFAGHLHRLRRKTANVVERTSVSDGTATNLLQQVIEKDNAAPHSSADVAIDYIINKASELSLGINAWVGKWPENSNMNTVVSTPGGSVTEQYLQNIAGGNSYLGADINFGYTRRFKRAGQEITVQVQNSPSRDLSDYDAVSTAASKEMLYREVNNSKTRNREWTFQADYVHPLNAKGTIHLETGAKVILRNVSNRYDVLTADSSETGGLVFQPDRSDIFKYSQDVLAAYGMFRLNLKRNWFIEAGTRLEATYINGDFTHSETSFTNRFQNVVPTATVSKKLDDKNTVTLSYTKRLTRPYIWDLNPNVNASDPKNIHSGNPFLQPEIAQQAEIAYGLNTGQTLFLNTAVFWKQTRNAIIEFIETNAEGVSFTSKQNLAGNRQFGLNLSATSHLSDSWTANGNVNINYLDYSSAALSIFRSGWGSDININSTYKLPRNFSVQAFGEYNTRQVTLLGTLGRTFYYSFAAKKEIKKARMTVTLATVNPFTNYVAQADHKKRPTFLSSSENRYYNRAVKLTLNWEFGGAGKHQGERKKIDNNDINVQGKG